jgi:hypothetical protein
MLSWGYTVHKMQETTVCTTLVNLGSKLFAPGQYGVSPKKSSSIFMWAQPAPTKLKKKGSARLDKISDLQRVLKEFTVIPALYMKL